MSIAAPGESGWLVRVTPVGEVATLLERLRAEAAPAPAALGVDAPIGLPAAYARAHLGRHAGFPDFLAHLGRDDPFFRVCDRIDQVSPARPFFPNTTRHGPRRAAQAARLGLERSDDLLRLCDRKTATRPRAACLFWTLGANQVGKAALSLWRDLLLDALASPEAPGVWPFDGRLAPLLRTRAVVIAETYPAEAMRQLGIVLAGSKRRQSDRAGLATAIDARMRALDATPDRDLRQQIATGFGADADGEDRFDSLLGLLGLLHVIREPHRDVVPPDDAILKFEGWSVGQALPTP